MVNMSPKAAEHRAAMANKGEGKSRYSGSASQSQESNRTTCALEADETAAADPQFGTRKNAHLISLLAIDDLH